MKFSAPIYRLKRDARLRSRNRRIPLHQALDHIAQREGYKNWSLLAAKLSALTPAAKLFRQLVPSNLLLIGARPGQGKTLLSLELAIEAIKSGYRGKFFSLEFTARDVRDCLRSIGTDQKLLDDMFEFDCSDAICADYIIEVLTSAPRGTLVVIDYLQLLDQRRDKPGLTTQVQALKSFAAERELIIVVLSQIDRSYDPYDKPFPSIEDVRLPNPLDLTLFDKASFLHNGEIQFQALR